MSSKACQGAWAKKSLDRRVGQGAQEGQKMENRPPNDADDAASASSALQGIRFSLLGPTVLLSFTTAILTIPTLTMMYFLSC